MGQGFEADTDAVGALLSTDTVFAALERMQRQGLTTLPIVDQASGAWLGQVSSDELLRWWRSAPLALLSEILTGRGRTFPEEKDRPRITLVCPLAEVVQQSRRWLQ